jgi:hypothetical protein
LLELREKNQKIIFDGIINKGMRNKPLSEPQRNRLISKKRFNYFPDSALAADTA